jgi:hypothetical protein
MFAKPNLDYLRENKSREFMLITILKQDYPQIMTFSGDYRTK